jgi:hypothetical protein
MEHPIRNEEDAMTAAIEDHMRSFGMGDARTMARVVLARLEQHRARKAAEQAADAAVKSEPAWVGDATASTTQAAENQAPVSADA